MGWIDAPSIAAEVVDVEALWNRTLKEFVSRSVGGLKPTVQIELAVAP